MACGDGRVQYLRLNRRGEEAGRLRSDVFFDVASDPVYDYAVPTDDGWLFMTLDGKVFEVTVEGDDVVVSEPWSINPPDEENAVDLNGVPIPPDDDWRMGGRQPFAYNAEHGMLFVLMHQGGGQETFEDPGTEIWAFNATTKRRGYRLALEDGIKASGVQVTRDSEPLLILSPSGSDDVMIHDALSSRHLLDVTEVGDGLIQNLD
jgi:methylamine dehydrogenase heavy chain